LDDLSHAGATGTGGTARRGAQIGTAAQDLDTLANLAHELRTPAQVLLGYLEILREDMAPDLTARMRPLISRMQSHAHDLAFAIENLLDFARVRTGAELADDEDVDLDELGVELRPALEIANSEKGLALAINLDSSCGSVRIRHRALRAILLNLALNAIKFTDNGSVTISAHRRTGGSNGDTIEFEVKDTGPGIAAAELERAFEPWAQLSASTTRRHRGLGLGLTVVKRNLSAVGGNMKVESSRGGGSKFTVTIPCVPAPQMIEPREPKPSIFGGGKQPALVARPKAPPRQPSGPRVPRSRP